MNGGSSFAAPQATGTIALLAQDARALPNWTADQRAAAQRHEVMKAILMNSADMVQGVLGMRRTVRNLDNQPAWANSDARDVPSGNAQTDLARQALPLDAAVGTGILNASRAKTQLEGGQQTPGNVGNIGWDYRQSNGQNNVQEYVLPQMQAGSWVSITAAWDRTVTKVENANVNNNRAGLFDWNRTGGGGLVPASDTFTSAALANLDVYLLPANANNINQALWASTSTTYNVEHMLFQIPNGRDPQAYKIWVRQVGTTAANYVLAWWAQPNMMGGGMAQGTAWIDGNKNGTWGSGENGHAGVSVDLFRADGTWLNATTTDGDGHYQFSGLDSGDYYVVFTGTDGYTFTEQHVGSDNTEDSDADGNGRSDTFTITSTEDVTLDVGLAPLPTGSVSGQVWDDADGDGIQDSSETSQEGVTVNLYDSADNLIATAATDANGTYQFNWLPANDYYVAFAVPVNYGVTTQDAGTDDTLDSDADQTGTSNTFTLGANAQIEHLDTGLVLTHSSVQGYAWNDGDGDGLQDTEEYAVSYAEVKLYDSSSNLVATTYADDSGRYEFDLLAAGDYYVVFTKPYGFAAFGTQDAGTDDALDSDTDASGQTDTFTLGSAEIRDHVDAGLVPVQYGSISNFVWRDTNGNGIQDTGEPGIAGVFVDLFDADDHWVDSVSTDADGHYAFQGVVPGDYSVTFALPAHFAFTSQNSGSDTAVDSDADANGETAVFTLGAAEDKTNLDAGLEAINQAPVGTSKTVTILENTAYSFAGSDFGFSDPNDAPANSLQAVKITTLPSAGTLTNNGMSVGTGDFISVSDLNAGHLVFTPAANASGSAYASFTFQVRDDGGTGHGGCDTDGTPRTMTVNVTWVNQAPVGTNNTVTTAEDTPYTFTLSDFGFTDPNEATANSFYRVKIVSLPNLGTLTNDGVAVSAGGFVTASNVSGGKLVFTPAANAFGTSYASLQFRVQDSGGTANGGSDLDATDRTLTVDVTAVNDAPVHTVPTSQTTNEDTVLVFSTTNGNALSVADVDAGSSSVQVTLTATHGTLTLNGTSGVSFSTGDGFDDATMTLIGPISAVNAALNGLSFTTEADYHGSASVQIVTSDLGNTGSGGALEDDDTVTVTVSSVNDAPVNTVPSSPTAGEDTALVFSTTNGNALSVADVDAGSSSVQVTLTATHGTLTLGSTSGLSFSTGDGSADVTMTFTGTVLSINLALNGLSFAPTADYHGSASVRIVTSDLGNAGSGGTLGDDDTVSITVNDVNDAPTGADGWISPLDGFAMSLWASLFGFSDSGDGQYGNNFLGVYITTLPDLGTLTLNGAAVSANDFISLSDINNNLLVYTPPSGSGSSSFTFRVRDDGGTDNGGIDTDPIARTMTINIYGI